MEKRMNRKRCVGCKQHYYPTRAFQIGCSRACQAIIKQAQESKRIRNMKKKDVKPLQWFVDRAKRAAQEYARHRDAHLPCVSCGRGNDKVKAWNGGHYRSAGNNRALMMHPLNIHKQCVRCNQFYSGNHNGDGGGVGYHIGIVERIGEEAKEWLLKDHGKADWTRDELELLYSHFKSLTKKLQSETQQRTIP